MVTAATIDAESGEGQKTQEFALEVFPESAYDLVVSKQCHLNFKLTGITVGNDNLDLINSSDLNISIISLCCGDINGDGHINSSDLSVIIVPANYGKQISEAFVNKLADLNGDGHINSSDLSIVIVPANYGKTHVVYAY